MNTSDELRNVVESVTPRLERLRGCGGHRPAWPRHEDYRFKIHETISGTCRSYPPLLP